MKNLFKIIKYWLGFGHKCEFTRKVINDMGTQILEVCWLCGALDGVKFWKQMNDKWNKKFPPVDNIKK